MLRIQKLCCFIVLFIFGSVFSQDNDSASNHGRNSTLSQGRHRLNPFLNETENNLEGVINEPRNYHNKFIETIPGGIEFDNVDIVLLRLKNISMMTSCKISEILAIQEDEFKANTIYQEGWDMAVEIFNDSKREKIFNNTTPDSIVQKVPIEYHIALIAYTLAFPSVYYEFNKDTREVCSGADIDNYQWKSYFKLLQLAVETLGSQVDQWRDNKRFSYRGTSPEFNLQEGQTLAFQHFISTSAALRRAEGFARMSLFEIQGIYNGTAMAIWDHSEFESEEEVLFLPFQTFKVDSIHVGRHYTRYVLVKNSSSSRYYIQTPLYALILLVIISSSFYTQANC